MTELIFVLVPLVLICLGVPIFLVLFSISILGIFQLDLASLKVIQSTMFGGLDNFTLLAIPLFILAGDIMAQGGIAKRLIAFIMTLVGGIPGSMGVAAIGSASAFGAMSGSSVACVAAIGKLTIPAMEQQGYGKKFATSLIAATGVIDIIIPPSISIIVYAITAQVSVTKLFTAGIVPGIIIAIFLACYVMVRAGSMNIARTTRSRFSEIAKAARSAVWAMMAPVIIIGGIYGGVFTPTEAAGIACAYAAFISVYIYKELNWVGVWRICVHSTILVAQIMLLVAASTVFGWVITTSGMPQELVSLVAAMHLENWQLLLLINVLLLFVGSILEPSPAILILTPLMAPLIVSTGIDPIHFGIIVTINLAIGMFLPPFGINLFAANALFKVPMPQLYRGVLPFLVIYLIVLVMITYIPQLTTVPVSWLS
ncbi:TRAP-type C4-dicarboxylate transport system, large permease component [Pantoea sp. AS-PWVM4]|uniref:TRAP transporter large permease n=1 Tax=Pantoea sp. AS-PWVM4 TaxID=1332069 RepID=UPI0003AC86FB|nr:TRAP transporter large permease [Pantoea sp. AS-PWVM4]ERK16291.1 TRAP-type C4-dicarboxylate transport system, large permease component [Pantoea sp. AS-PWVM4]